MYASRTLNQALPPLRKILIIGSGGRENALAWAFSRIPEIEDVWVTPGNGGTSKQCGCTQLNCAESNIEELINISNKLQIDLVVIGPEAPLAAGLADQLRTAGIAVFGPSAKGALLEASKTWAKDLMNEAKIPTATHWAANTKEEALDILNRLNRPVVVKADGLASGKGVFVPHSIDETAKAINEAFSKRFSNASDQVILEEKLEGPEVSIFALCDGKQMVVLPPAQDHKRLSEGDTGPNTGGMGAYSPAPLVNSKDLETIKKTILEPTLMALKSRDIDYRGVIYAGLMLTSKGPQVIEFNCRFGDPECQALMPLLGSEIGQIIHACALGSLELAQTLSIKEGCSACVVAAADGYPKSPRLNDPIKIDVKPKDNLQIFHSGTNCKPNGELFTSGGRVMSVVAQGKTFNEAFKVAYKGLEQVHFDGITYRRDIGHQVRS